MKKQKTITKLKKDLWLIFTKYIKLKYSKDGEYVTCFTCGINMKIGTSNCQGGHWLTKKGYPFLYFHENNVRPQCYHCNINLSGNTAVFERKLIDELGKEDVEWMYNNRHGVGSTKKERSDYLELIEIYKEKVLQFDKNN